MDLHGGDHHFLASRETKHKRSVFRLMRNKSSVAMGVLMASILVNSGNVSAADLTGSYEGTISCTLSLLDEETGKLYTRTDVLPADLYVSLQEAPPNQIPPFVSEKFYQIHYQYGEGGTSPVWKASHLANTVARVAPDNEFEQGLISMTDCGDNNLGNIESALSKNAIDFGAGNYLILANGKASLKVKYYNHFSGANVAECDLNVDRYATEDPLVERDPGFPYTPQEYTCPQRFWEQFP